MSSDFLIEQYYAKYEFTTKHMLSSSDAESFTVDELINLQAHPERAKAQLLSLHLGYTESSGSPILRQKISDLYDGIVMDQVLIYTGAEEGIFSFVYGYLNSEDHIIVMFPAYQSLYQVALDHGVEVSNWYCREDKDWCPDFEKLPRLIRKNTRAIVINSPHNPTGFQFSQKQLDEIVDICRQHDLILFCDEVYRFGEYNNQDRLSSASEIYDKAISLGVMSKPMGLPGLRIGWIVTQDPEIYSRLQNFKYFTTICGSAPSEYLAQLALDALSQIIERNLNIITSNLELLKQFMKRNAGYLTWVEPKAGNVAFIRLKGEEDVEKFCDQLRVEKEVLLLPSTTYQYGNHHFRIGFGRKNFPEALNLLDNFLQEQFISD